MFAKLLYPLSGEYEIQIEKKTSFRLNSLLIEKYMLLETTH